MSGPDRDAKLKAAMLEAIGRAPKTDDELYVAVRKIARKRQRLDALTRTMLNDGSLRYGRHGYELTRGNA